jgi:hypothetical protein
MEKDEGQTAAGDAQVEAFAVIGDKRLHSVQHFLSAVARLKLFTTTAVTGIVVAHPWLLP